MPEVENAKKNFRSLSFTLAVTFLILTWVLLLVTGVLELYFSLQVQQRSIINQQQLIAQDAANQVSSFVKERLQMLATTARLANLTDAGAAEQKLILSKLLGLEYSFRQVVLLDSQRQELTAVSRLSKKDLNRLEDRINADIFFQTDQGQTFLSQVYIDEVTSEPLIIMATAIKDVFGDSKGTLMAEVNLKFMWDLVGDIKIGQGGTAFVVDRQGNLIAFGDVSRVLRGENLSNLKEVDEFMNNEEQTKRADRVKGIEGTNVISGFVALGTPDWAVVVELPFREAYSSIVGQIIIGLAIMILFFGFSLVATVYVSRKITRPVKELRDAAIEIGKGNLDKKVEVKTNDEIGELAETFNIMIAKLKSQKERDEVVSKMKSEFISITAHQLRTPLSALKWTFDLIKEGSIGKFTDEQMDYLENCRLANEKMIDTINDLLDITRIEEGRFLYEFSEIQMDDLIKELIGGMKLEMARKKLKINFLEPDLPVPKVKVDADKISMVIRNLLENAVRYTPKGGRIDVSLERKPDEIMVKVQDTGIGIPADQRQRVFSKFFRAKNALTVETSGSGLGLYIAKNVVEKHGGRIWFDSEENKGSAFYFTIPLNV